MIKEIIYRGCR